MAACKLCDGSCVSVSRGRGVNASAENSESCFENRLTRAWEPASHKSRNRLQTSLETGLK
eukprot:361342-Pleurochrysis_carterae.AAC.1